MAVNYTYQREMSYFDFFANARFNQKTFNDKLHVPRAHRYFRAKFEVNSLRSLVCKWTQTPKVCELYIYTSWVPSFAWEINN